MQYLVATTPSVSHCYVPVEQAHRADMFTTGVYLRHVKNRQPYDNRYETANFSLIYLSR